jgi:photosystem II stability/assembly factor-like uncharacterized protein
MLVDWAGGRTVVGVTPDGAVAVSDDAGLNWTTRANVSGTPHALTATKPTKASSVDIVVVTRSTVVHSRDGGTTFSPLDPSRLRS